jgi:hypothetical protein
MTSMSITSVSADWRDNVINNLKKNEPSGTKVMLQGTISPAFYGDVFIKEKSWADMVYEQLLNRQLTCALPRC